MTRNIGILHVDEWLRAGRPSLVMVNLVTPPIPIGAGIERFSGLPRIEVIIVRTGCMQRTVCRTVGFRAALIYLPILVPNSVQPSEHFPGQILHSEWPVIAQNRPRNDCSTLGDTLVWLGCVERFSVLCTLCTQCSQQGDRWFAITLFPSGCMPFVRRKRTRPPTQ